MLAINGGKPVVTKEFRKFQAHGLSELLAGYRVLSSKRLSSFYGSLGAGFLGGPQVKSFERRWEEKFEVRHAISVNSWTSGLEVAVASLGLELGSEVLVPSWTMSATVASIRHAGLTPAFIDVDAETYIPGPPEILAGATEKTRGVLIADIFGLSADWTAIRELAKENGWLTVGDSAQAPGVRLADGWAGTFAHIGGFSLNYHKHIHTGEGGMIVTNDSMLAERAQLLRNHAEAVVAAMPEEERDEFAEGLVGHNFRLGELEAALGISQLAKIDRIVSQRRRVAIQLRDGLQHLEGLTVPNSNLDEKHAYYVLPMRVDHERLGVSRDVLAKALRAEGIPVMSKYINCHRMPAFRRHVSRPLRVTEALQDREFLGIEICSHNFDSRERSLVIDAFTKVWDNIHTLSQA